MSVTAAKGFVASGVHAGIRRKEKDLAVVRSTVPAVGTAMQTVNRVQAAPVLVTKEHLAAAEPQAIVVNSGVANAATGERGLLDAIATAAEAGRLLDLQAEEVLILSTGVIGPLLPLDRVLAGLREAVPALAADGGADAAAAILTTDTCTKEAAVSLDGFTVGGMAKGSGMIHPQLATMLAVVTTDYPLEPGEPLAFLRPAVETSFNSISVDGECSTNDAVCLLANGASGIERTPASDTAFALALGRVCEQLAEQIVADGEGATMVAEIEVTGAEDAKQARAIAARIATSPLVKTALFGARRELGPRTCRCGLRAVQRRLRAPRSRPRHALLQRRHRPRPRRAAGRRARRLERRLPDRARPRPRAGQRELPDERPLLRLREDQRGLPHVKPVVVKLGGAVAAEAAEIVLGLAAAKPVVVVHGAGAQISDEMQQRGLEVRFVAGRRVTTQAALRGRPRVAGRSERDRLRSARRAGGAALRRRDRSAGDADPRARLRR